MRVLVLPKWYPWPDRPVSGCSAASTRARRRCTTTSACSPSRPSGCAACLPDLGGPDEPVPTTRLIYRRPACAPAAMATQLVGMERAVRR